MFKNILGIYAVLNLAASIKKKLTTMKYIEGTFKNV